MRLLGLPLDKRSFQSVPRGLVSVPSGLLSARSWIRDNQTTAGLPVVYGCLQVLTQALCSMPMRVLNEQRKEVRKPSWLEKPTPGFTGSDLVSQMVVSLVQQGNAFLLPVRVSGEVAEVFCAKPDSVHPQVDLDGFVTYDVGGQPYGGEIVHVRYIALPGQVMGLSGWDTAMGVVQIGSASKDFVYRHFNQSAFLQMALVAKGSVAPEDKIELAAQVRAAHMGGAAKAWSPLVLDNDMTVQQLSMTAEQAQFLELTTMTNAEIAAQIFRVDPSLLGITQTGSSLTYSNLVDRSAQLYNDVVHPLAVRIEDALSELLPLGHRVDLDSRRWLSGSPRDQAQIATRMNAVGAFTVNEIREAMGYVAIEGGDEPPSKVAFQDQLPPATLPVGQPAGENEPTQQPPQLQPANGGQTE